MSIPVPWREGVRWETLSSEDLCLSLACFVSLFDLLRGFLVTLCFLPSICFDQLLSWYAAGPTRYCTCEGHFAWMQMKSCHLEKSHFKELPILSVFNLPPSWETAADF